MSELKDYYGGKHDELQMPMDLMLTKLKFSAPVFREHIGAVDASGEWPTWVISNHDIVRSWNRYGDGKHNDQIAKDMAAMYLTLRGTPIMYYGEEIGMQNNNPKRREDVKDPIGRTGWPKEIGRDGERTPMQWSNTPNAGFTTGIPWLPIPVTYKTYNVANELKDPNSILNWYKGLLALRHQDKALLDGDYIALNQDDPNVLSYLRHVSGRCGSGGHQHVGEFAKSDLRLGEAGLRLGNGQDLDDHSAVVEERFVVYATLAGAVCGLYR